MEAELAALETKIRLAAELCRRLRDENRELRRQLAALADGNKALADRMEGARGRLELVLRQIPE